MWGVTAYEVAVVRPVSLTPRRVALPLSPSVSSGLGPRGPAGPGAGSMCCALRSLRHGHGGLLVQLSRRVPTGVPLPCSLGHGGVSAGPWHPVGSAGLSEHRSPAPTGGQRSGETLHANPGDLGCPQVKVPERQVDAAEGLPEGGRLHGDQAVVRTAAPTVPHVATGHVLLVPGSRPALHCRSGGGTSGSRS